MEKDEMSLSPFSIVANAKVSEEYSNSYIVSGNQEIRNYYKEFNDLSLVDRDAKSDLLDKAVYLMKQEQQKYQLKVMDKLMKIYIWKLCQKNRLIMNCIIWNREEPREHINVEKNMKDCIDELLGYDPELISVYDKVKLEVKQENQLEYQLNKEWKEELIKKQKSK
jgi:hypothetical protein